MGFISYQWTISVPKHESLKYDVVNWISGSVKRARKKRERIMAQKIESEFIIDSDIYGGQLKHWYVHQFQFQSSI